MNCKVIGLSSNRGRFATSLPSVQRNEWRDVLCFFVPPMFRWRCAMNTRDKRIEIYRMRFKRDPDTGNDGKGPRLRPPEEGLISNHELLI